MSADLVSRIVAATFVFGAAITSAAADETGLASMHDLRREGGRLCMSDHYHFGNGGGATRGAAQNSAIRSWADFTDFEYGSDWARFSRAASKSVSCGRGGSGWECQIQARPCR
jgi:hypothetical protein